MRIERCKGLSSKGVSAVWASSWLRLGRLFNLALSCRTKLMLVGQRSEAEV